MREWETFIAWWKSLPESERALLLVLFTVCVGIAGWILTKGIPAVIRYLYGLVLERLDAAKEELSMEAKEKFATPIGQTEHKIIEKSGVWPWLARRALRWRNRTFPKSSNSPVRPGY